MPQIEKGGKYIFGWSLIRSDGNIQIPEEAIKEYHLVPGENVFLISGSKTTGGFIVTTKTALVRSKLTDIIHDLPALLGFRLPEGNGIKYKGRFYCWTGLKPGGRLVLFDATMSLFGVKRGDHLLAIRGSHIGVGMGVKGPIIEAARQHPEITVF